jgi:amidophosphoribosyltransferase
VEGAYSLVALTAKKLIGVRDPWGVRPLVLGKLGRAFILASETCALDIIGAEFVRDIEPGELVVITKDGIESYFRSRRSRAASASSNMSISPGRIPWSKGRNVYDARKRIGEELAREAPAPGADMVVPVPDSGVPAALGYARRRHCRSNSASSATIMSAAPSSSRRTASAIWACGSSTIPIAPSSRASAWCWWTIPSCAARPRRRSWRWCAMRARPKCISASRVRPRRIPASTASTRPTGDLLAHRMEVEQMREYIEADSLAFVSMNGLYRAVGEVGRNAAIRNSATPASPANIRSS